MIRSKQLSYLFGLIGALLMTSCINSPARTGMSATVVDALRFGDDAAYVRPTAPMDFVFPRDHGPHPAYRTEWWYYTGNLTDEAGQAYGYQLTFFRSALAPDAPQRASDLATNQLYMAHFALTDAAADRYQSFERFSRGAGGLAGAQGEPSYQVWLEDWSASAVTTDTMRLQARAEGEIGTVALDLTMRETRPIVLHGDQGLSHKGGDVGNANYYYSLVQMATTGTVTMGEKVATVTGRSWMDHEFGTSALTGDTTGWDWFAVQLDDGTALMFGEFHNADGENRSVYEGTLAYPVDDPMAGRQVTLGAGAFQLEALDTWTSPRSGITYPHGWHVTFPEYAIELEIQPLIPDQELAVSFVYYEGATTVTGTRDGKPIQGVGYVELTGYGAKSDNVRSGQ